MSFRFLLLVAFLAISALTGCASPYEKFYQSSPPNLNGSIEVLPPSGEPRIGSLSANPRHDVLAMYEQGYALIGHASFVGPLINQNQALQQAKKVGAEVVLIGTKYRNTVNGAMPITTPTTTTSYSNGTASAFGSGGYASGMYSGTTTTYGSQTDYIPYSVDKYDQGALFFAPLPRTGLGIKFEPPTEEQKQKANTNQMILVMAVRKESPAFKADILAGDLLLSVDGKPVYDLSSLHDAAANATEKPVKFVLLRKDKQIIKNIQIPDSW